MKLTILVEDAKPDLLDLLASEFNDIGLKSIISDGRMLYVSNKTNPITARMYIRAPDNKIVITYNIIMAWHGTEYATVKADKITLPVDLYKQGSIENIIKEVSGRLNQPLSQKPVPMEITGPVPSDKHHAYHITNLDNASQIAEQGLITHLPWFGTDQRTWPDGATSKRSYWMDNAEHILQFAPEEGKPVLLRTDLDERFIRETTGDYYTCMTIHQSTIDIYCEDGKWHNIASAF